MNVFFVRLFSLILCASGCAHAAVKAKLASQFLARGEQTLFEIRIEDSDADEMPVIPEIKGVVIEPIGFGPAPPFPGRRLEYRFKYLVYSYAVGPHVIPPIEVSVGGVRSRTEPVRMEIFDPNELEWKETASEPAEMKETVRYASIIKVPERKVFENQSIPAEIKIYIPRDLARSVADWGVPEFERKGLAAWRFEPSESPGEVNLLGQPYVSWSYPTTMTAITSGLVEIGPATVRLIYVKTVLDRFAQRMQLQATLEVPKLGFTAAPLPEGAPDGYDNAVGQFTLGTAIKETEVKEGEPLAVDVIVSGSGNLDNLRSPKMIDQGGWKVYDATPNQRGAERTDLNGTVVFSQFLRPLEMKTSVPPFRLVYFDPEKEKYETLTTAPIALSMTAASMNSAVESSGPPQALPLPVERMTGILGLLNGRDLLVSPEMEIPGWLGHALAIVISLALIARALWMRYGHLLEKDEVKILKRKDFMKVSDSVSSDGAQFLRSAGGFVEKWLSPEKDGEIRGILEERDRVCFRATKEETLLPRNRREQILKSLKRAAFGLILFAFSMNFADGADTASLAKQAYDSGKFEEAAKLWLDAGPYDRLSADTLYNIGNAAYTMGATGQAALYYRRALSRDAAHEESRQNLRYIERKYGAITIARPNYQYALANIPLSVWRGGLWAGVWMLVIGLLIFPATRPGSRWRVAGVVGFIVGPLMMSVGALGWNYYPDDADFAPLAKQAVIVGEKVVLHSDAARTSPEIIDAPPGSLAEVLQRSGRWAYIGFATKTRGWVPVESIQMVVPKGKPEPPKLKKTTADGSSA